MANSQVDYIAQTDGSTQRTPGEQAAALARFGIPVFPLWSVTNGVCGCGNAECKDAGKHPHRLALKGYHSATDDLRQVALIWEAAPQANVGINLVGSEILDIGPDSVEWLDRFKERGLPPTVVVQSGGGEGHRHYWYRRPRDSPIMRSCKSGEYDILSDGYAIAPPSMHKSGNAYTFLTSPCDLGIDHVSQLPEAPAWAVEMMENASAARTDFTPIDPAEPPVRLDGAALGRWNGQGASGDRSMALVKIAEDLAKAGLTRRGIVDALRDRDTRLWTDPKYAERTDAEKRYAEIADGAIKTPGQAPDVTRTAGKEEGHRLLDDVEALLKTYIAYPSDHDRVAHVLWIVHTHMMDAWDSTPRLAFLSPEPSSGKSRALEVTHLLVPRALEAMNMSSAYLFRKMDSPDGLPTILFDEVDAIFGPKTAKDHEDVRALINAGHRKGSISGRCVTVGREVQTVDFPAYGAVALGGLGDLPDTIMARSVVVQMRRRRQGEKIRPFRRREAEKAGRTLYDRLAAWSATAELAMGNPWPEMPEGIEDSDADVWEALLCCADAAGGDWPARARTAAVRMVEAEKAKPASLGIRLLTDLRTIFGDRDKMHTEDIIVGLCDLPEARWSEINDGKPLNTGGLASRLAKYDVKSKSVRDGAKVARGYTREDLADPWDRYLPPPTSSAADVAHVARIAGDGEKDESEAPQPVDFWDLFKGQDPWTPRGKDRQP